MKDSQIYLAPSGRGERRAINPSRRTINAQGSRVPEASIRDANKKEGGSRREDLPCRGCWPSYKTETLEVEQHD